MMTMPTITDRMVDEFRRTANDVVPIRKVGTSDSASRGARVVPQFAINFNPCVGKPNNVSCGDDCYCCDGFPKYGSPC